MLRLDHVTKRYRVGTFGSRELVAVRDVSLEVRPGEVVALIGQSGSGKSTIGRMILRLTSASEGTISFDGADVAGFTGARLRAYYADVQGVFQDPFSSYNPVFKVDRTLEQVRETWFARLEERAWRDKVEASSMLMISSATSSRMSSSRALATSSRCSCPPLSWCGYLPSTWPGSRRTASSDLSTLARHWRPSMPAK